MFRRILALCALLLLVFSAFAQAEGSATPLDPLATMSELERKTLSLDIAVSSYYELKAMAERYGLSTSGASEELRARIYQYLKLSPPAKPAPASSVTIESASSFEYFTLDDSSDRMIRLLGPVSLSVTTEDGFSHKITADEIVYDRDKNIIQAKGDVVYLREGSGRSDRFTGSTITVDLGSYSGVFLDGAYSLEPTAATKRTLSFHFEKLTRRGPDLTMLDQAIVTGCDELPPHYHIRAKKVWLFENGDWALSGATLYLGVVPVIWLPFFYYPSDEILFHPVIGYRSREGAFAQTTTYLIGEKSQGSDTSSSLSLFSQQGLTGSRSISGIFIQRLQSAAGAPAENGGSGADGGAGTGAKLKLLADIYSALGAYLGVEGNTPETKAATLDYSFGLGLSRSLFLESNGYYSPFDYANGYASAWNSSNFLGFKLPFRFGLDFSYSYKKTTGSLRYSLAIEAPLYSDPYFEQDFMQRNESSGMLSAMDANTTAIVKRSSMTQSLQSSLTWASPVSKGFSLLEKAGFSKLAAQMTWKSKTQPTTGLATAQKRLLAVDPQRDFYYPDTLKPLDGAFSLSGTIFRYDSNASKAGGESQKPDAEVAKADKDGATTDKDGAKGDKEGGQANARDYSRFFSTLGWSASGTANVEEKFYTSAWAYPENVDGALSYFLLGWKGNARLASSSDWAQKLVSMQTGLGFSSQDQWRPYLYDDRTAPTTVHPYRLSDYAYKMTSVDASAVLALSPFLSGSEWSASSLQYSIGGTIYKYGYAGLSVGGGVNAAPLYESTWIGWNSDTLSTHNLAATLSLAPRNKAAQKLSFSAYLPPLLEKYTAAYSLSSKYLKASLSGSVSKASELADLLPSNLASQIIIGSAPFPVLKSDFSWDFGAAAPLSSVSSLEYGWAKLGFTAKKSKGYAFSDGLWSPDGSESFRPYEASVALVPKIGNAANTGAVSAAAAGNAANPSAPGTAGNSLKLSILPTISYTQNLVRFTESTLGAGIDLSLTSPQGTSLSFTSASANKSAWRYWPSLFPVTSSFDPNDYYRNFFSDLAASLTIWDPIKLKSSLFKLQSLSLKLSQDLHDWDFQAALAMSPVLVTPDSGRPYYQLDFSFSLSVTWKDIPELKASVSYQDGGFTE